MNKLIIIAPNGDACTKDVGRDFEHASALKEYLDENEIEYNEEINNGHKLCLDLSRQGYWIFRSTDSSCIMYIGDKVSSEQYDWYEANSYFIDNLNIISVASWYDRDYEVGYDVFEQDSISFNTERKRKDTITKLIKEKNKSNEKSKFRLFGRAK
jgi:hypothetical protein